MHNLESADASFLGQLSFRPLDNTVVEHSTSISLTFLNWAIIAYTQNHELGVFLYGMQYQSRPQTSEKYEYLEQVANGQQVLYSKLLHTVL
jgi:hypothetical protein